MQAAADATTTLRIGALVLCNDYRHPVVLAKEVATVDVLSGGRVEVGVGAGWMTADYDAAGIALDPPGTRIRRLAEALDVLDGLWADGACSVEGEHYRITGLDGLPKPVQRPRPPLLLGGGGRRMLSLAGRRADIVGINVDLSKGVIDADAGSTAPPPRPTRRSAGCAPLPATASTTSSCRCACTSCCPPTTVLVPPRRSGRRSGLPNVARAVPFYRLLLGADPALATRAAARFESQSPAPDVTLRRGDVRTPSQVRVCTDAVRLLRVRDRLARGGVVATESGLAGAGSAGVPREITARDPAGHVWRVCVAQAAPRRRWTVSVERARTVARDAFGSAVSWAVRPSGVGRAYAQERASDQRALRRHGAW